MSASNYLENLVLNWIKGTNAASAPSSVYVGLFNGDPGEAGSGGTEVTTTVRVAGRVAVSFGSISGGAILNSGIVDFGLAAGGATVTHWALFDASSSGNMLAYGALDVSRTIVTGNAVSFAVGAIEIEMD